MRKVKQLFLKGRMRSIIGYGVRSKKIDAEWGRILSRIAEERQSFDTVRMMKSFLNEQIILKKKAETWGDRLLPAVICVEKDSLIYLKAFLPYYRGLGIRHFIFIDNGSSDGTAECLIREKDVSFFTAPFRFCHNAKTGWILQAVRMAGTDQWYLRLDADEFLTWPGMEDSSIGELMSKKDLHGCGTLRSMMLDMYPDHAVLEKTSESDDFMEDLRWFDDARDLSADNDTGAVFGGMRRRVLGAELRMDKYILFSPENGYIPIDSHSVTGIRNPEERKFFTVLRHYKFLPGSGEKIARISAEKGAGYASGKEVGKYRAFIEKKINAVNRNSIEYTSSESLYKLGFIRPL